MDAPLSREQPSSRDELYERAAQVSGRFRSGTHHALLVAVRRELSPVDCVSLEAMQRAGLETRSCFDRHFAEQGFAVMPAALP